MIHEIERTWTDLYETGGVLPAHFVFDATPALRDFGWSPNGFRPIFIDYNEPAEDRTEA
jgi:hypothetical protein